MEHDERNDRLDEPRPQHHERMICVIFGGSKVSGISFFVEKRLEREANKEPHPLGDPWGNEIHTPSGFLTKNG